MRTKIKSLVLFFLKLLAIFLLAYYVLKDIDFSTFMSEISHYSLFALLLVVLAIFTSNLAMSLRWKLMSQDSVKSSMEAVLIASSMNILLPARLGEMAKALYLKRYYGKSLSRSLSLILFERFFDVFFLVSGALFVLFDLINNPDYEPIFFSILMFQILLLVMIKYYSYPIYFVARFLPIRYLRVYAKKIIRDISRKVNSITLAYTLMSTLLVWVVNFFTTYIFLHIATDFHLSTLQIFVVFVITGVGFVLPLLPAGALTFQASYILALGLYGVPQSEALAASLVFHIVYIITMLIPGKMVLLFQKEKQGSNNE